MPPTEEELRADLARLGAELDRRGRRAKALERYYEGACPMPDIVTRANITRAYRMLMPVSEAPWGSLIVDSVQDRLEIAGIRSESKQADDAVWRAWQENQMDSESDLAHNTGLITGRAFALVWADKAGDPEISLDGPETMVVEYEQGSRRRRRAALRRWIDDDDGRPYATLYRPDGIYKFIGPKNSSGQAGTQWDMREVPGERWPLGNPLEVVPAVEIPLNRRLKPGSFGYARGEFEHCTGLIDRINLLTFLGLVVAFWMGFPLRGVIGDKILRDDQNKPLPPFDVHADKLFQLEDPAAKIVEFSAADRKNLAVFPELDQLAVVTKTPRHYFPLEQGMSNLSADAIRASEGGLNAKVIKHKKGVGEGWEEVLRLSGMIVGKELSPRAELVWKDHESRSLAERADAATKLASIQGLPWQLVAKLALNLTQDEITRAEAQAASDGIGQLVRAINTQPPTPSVPQPEPAAK